ncbi:MAG: HAMP domain-containing histidine kinase, partial [Desulfobacteraceae bacterium]|nr:HAMP domain-containing histidine kinase [Desulfobacteraceae bacterium]
LHHAEYKNKLASIGRLSSGVAHEINNPLAIINQKTGLIMDMFSSGKDFSSDERLIPLTNDILDAVQRCGAITRRLLDFAQHTEPSIESVNVEEVLEQMLAFLKKEAERRQIIISVDSKGPIPDFECDRGSLQQIFLNLFDNAFDAMEDGGRLDVFIKFKKKENLTIIVSDTGTGISNDDINKIFEPFYSSKNDHWGTGLGLSITYGLVKEIGGEIMVKSKIGKGTCFTLTLPLNIEVENGTR